MPQLMGLRGWAGLTSQTQMTLGLPLRSVSGSLGEEGGAEEPGQKGRPHDKPLIDSALPLPGCVTWNRSSRSLSLTFRLLVYLN